MQNGKKKGLKLRSDSIIEIGKYFQVIVFTALVYSLFSRK